MNQYLDAVYQKHIQKTVEALCANRMDAHFVKDSAELLELLEVLLPEGATIASGGSQTLEDTGVNALLSSGKYDYYYRGRTDEATGEKIDVYEKAFGCDWYFASSNAITENGELYNVDGNANRVAALCYGPRNVVIIAGANKLVKDLAEAEARVKAIAAPANCQRLNRDTGCRRTGRCVNCRTPDRICCTTVIHGFQRFENRIKVFILPQSLGF